MPNTTDGLFQTLVAGASLATQELRFQNSFLGSIYWDYKPIAQSPFTGLTVNIPTVNEANVVDIGGGPLQPVDTEHTSVTIPFDKHFSISFVIKDWDVVRTPEELSTKYLKGNLQALARAINRRLAGLVNTTNFSIYPLISGTGADLFNRTDVTGAWKNLADAGAPLEDDGNMFLIMNTTAYGNMLADSNWITQSIAADSFAISAQQRAKINSIYGCSVNFDQHMLPYNAGKQPGIMMHRYAIAGVTSRMLEPSDSKMRTTQFSLTRGLPVQMQGEYSMKDQGYLVNLHTWLGFKVVRPELGSLIETA